MSTTLFLPSRERPNGTRTVFRTASPYALGTVRVFLNGVLLQNGLDDGWVELGVDKVRMLEAPKDGHHLMFMYERP